MHPWAAVLRQKEQDHYHDKLQNLPREASLPIGAVREASTQGGDWTVW